MMTKKKILKLRPTFEFGGVRMVDWFTISEFDLMHGRKCCRIKSGLRHADGVTKSPYHYEGESVGKNAERDALKKFNEWWKSINYKDGKI